MKQTKENTGMHKYTINIDKELFNQFKQCANQNDMPASIVVRNLMRDYVAKNSAEVTNNPTKNMNKVN